MTLVPQELYNERADAYAKMSSLTWQLVDLRTKHACSLVSANPLPPVEQTEEFRKLKNEQLAEKARWIKACQEIRQLEVPHGA